MSEVASDRADNVPPGTGRSLIRVPDPEGIQGEAAACPVAIVDVHYRGDVAAAACAVARTWTSAEPCEERTATIAGVRPYRPGAFFERELPCIVRVLGVVGSPFRAIMIDGYVDLDGCGTPGMGAHLHAHLGGAVAVVGAAPRPSSAAPCRSGAARQHSGVNSRTYVRERWGEPTGGIGMRIGILGSGNIGGTCARLFADAGHEVMLSHSGPPETLREQVAKLGPRARAGTADDAAIFGEVVLLAIPWRERASLPASALRGKVAVDATNPYAPDMSMYDLGDSTSSEEVAKAVPGARLVKAFNTLFAKDLATRGHKDLPLPDRTVIFMAGDDEDAKRAVAELIREIGFAAVDTGLLRDGGRLQQPGSPIYARPLRAAEVPAALGMEDAGAGPMSSGRHP